MASPSAAHAARPNSDDAQTIATTPLDPSTPIETGLTQQDASQVTLPSTEAPSSPMDVDQSFKTELNDDRPATTVIPSSLTPPPSTQVAPQHGNARKPGLLHSQSQQSNTFISLSPPLTNLQPMRERDVGTDYLAPHESQIEHASREELQNMLRTCVAENQKFKMETAHHKLQFNLLSMQYEEERKRAAVEHEMIRREVDALRTAEHTRQARREIGTPSESLQTKYLQIKMWHEEALDENEALQRRVKVAKKVIQQKEEEVIALSEERHMLLNRIRENREHFHMLCSPGGMFHGAAAAAAPRSQHGQSTPQHQRGTPKHARSMQQRENSGHDGREHGLSALLEAIGQDDHSAPSTPVVGHHRAGSQRSGSKHSRNAQSMSSLPTTPVTRPRGEHASLLPSAELVPQTEPAQRYKHHSLGGRRRKSRESTISADDNEELARQALESVGAVHNTSSQSQSQSQSFSRGSRSQSSRRDDGREEDMYDSQASQAAAEMLRRDARQSFEIPPDPAGRSAKMQARLLPDSRGGAPGTAADKRKFSGGGGRGGGETGTSSPAKRMRVGGSLVDESRVGLGIQYRQ